MKFWLCVGGAVLALCGSAQAQTAVVPEYGVFPYQRWVDRAKVPTPDVTLTVIESAARCGSDGDPAAGCTVRGEYTIWLDTARRAFAVKRTFAHELGHNWLYYAADEADVAALTQLAEWRREPQAAVDEVLADTYATCALGGWRRLGLGAGHLPPLPRRQMISACYLIRHSPP